MLCTIVPMSCVYATRNHFWFLKDTLFLCICVCVSYSLLHLRLSDMKSVWFLFSLCVSIVCVLVQHWLFNNYFLVIHYYAQL